MPGRRVPGRVPPRADTPRVLHGPHGLVRLVHRTRAAPAAGPSHDVALWARRLPSSRRLRQGRGAGEHRPAPVELLRLRRRGRRPRREPGRQRQAPPRRQRLDDHWARPRRARAAPRCRRRRRPQVGGADRAAGLQRPAIRRSALTRRRAPRPPTRPPRPAHQSRRRTRRARAPSPRPSNAPWTPTSQTVPPDRCSSTTTAAACTRPRPGDSSDVSPIRPH